MIFARLDELVHVKDYTKALDTVQGKAVGLFAPKIEAAGPVPGIRFQSKRDMSANKHLSWLIEIDADKREFNKLAEKTSINSTLDASRYETGIEGLGLKLQAGRAFMGWEFGPEFRYDLFAMRVSNRNIGTDGPERQWLLPD